MDRWQHRNRVRVRLHSEQLNESDGVRVRVRVRLHSEQLNESDANESFSGFCVAG